MTYILGGIAIAIIAAIVIGGVIWQNNRTKTPDSGYGTVQNSDVKVQLQANGVMRLGLPNAAKTIDVWEDPLCPICGQFEKQYGQSIAKAIDDGKVAVQYHMVNFLNAGSHSGDYSTRADAALQCVAADGNGVLYSSFHTKLFENQPAERGSSDLSNQQLADLAKDAGASDQVQQCISSGSKVSAAAADAQTALQELAARGGKGTPSVYNGQTAVNISDPDWLSQL
ncbi:thioredoxin domain-containing protein [Skermania sp. ID1734]|uniref:DsbA family protein n=1 Tax=Skermania sp. ID1734 TaxID=2597516 RepID=UPI002107ADC3|nr:thioredoxin domain-containing protein [Skermania sp. ID1734]